MHALLNTENHSPLRYFGGKCKMAKHIIPLLPKHHCYIEPFGGGAHILAQKEPSKVEVYNDIDSDLVRFLLVLRNRKEELIQRLSTLPTSRYLTEKWQNEPLPEDELEAACRWFYLLRQTIVPANNQKSGWRSGKVKNTAYDYMNAVGRLDFLQRRMSNVMIECLDFREIIRSYDAEDSLFIIDPPYRHREKFYKGNFSDELHIELAELLRNIKGKALVTYYHDPLIDSLYTGWHMVEVDSVVGTGVCKAENGGKKKREREVFFMNFTPEYSLF